MSSSDKSDPARDARLDDLRMRFRTLLPQRIATITACAAAVRVGPWAVADAFLAEVHGLAGSAGLFGHDRIGEAAGALERVLIALERRQTVTAVDIATLRDAVRRLEAAFAGGVGT